MSKMLNFFKNTWSIYTDNFDTNFKNPMRVFMLSIILSLSVVLIWLNYLVNNNLYIIVANNIALIITSIASLFIMTSSYFITQIIHFLLYKRFFKFKWTLKPKERFEKAIIFLIIMITFQVLFSFILKLFFDDNNANQVINMNKFVLNIWFISLFLFPIIWAFEEFIFRWVLQQSLMKWLMKFFNEKFAWFVSIWLVSILFAILHIWQTTFHELIIIYFLSFFLWFLYIKYKDLKLNMLVHWLNNLFFVWIVFISFYANWNSIEYQNKLQQLENYWLNESVEFVARQIWENPYQVRYNPFALIDWFCWKWTAWKVLNDKMKLNETNCQDLKWFKKALVRDYALMQKIESDWVKTKWENWWLNPNDFLRFYEIMIKAIN